MSALTAMIWSDIFGGSGGGAAAKNAVLYIEQDLTEEQKTQARANIGAGNPSTGLPEDAIQDLLATLRAQAFATPNGAELIAALENDLTKGTVN